MARPLLIRHPALPCGSVYLMDSGRFSETDDVTIRVSPPDHKELAGAFRAWAGEEAALRVYFTPDVLIGIDARARRGYLYDDGWTVEVFVDEGIPELLTLLPDQYLAEHCQVERHTEEPLSQRGLLKLVLEEGAPIDEVRHLI